ncbi:sulfatase-like hydrolase/transferase, partial [uncultured Cyclobacterium sp.]|uniref:sulfatase-like hydrolase/transferase n=1 Tax=uncultured Cyclobacterium sp. TaxID=453820 RepID=UPI0030EB1D2F
MVSYMDEQVGELVEQLKSKGLYENTLIIFTSDNGPTFNGGTDSPWFNSGGAFREEKGFGKGFLYEGGIRVPMIASWPGKIKEGSVSDHASVFYDVMPTLAEVAGKPLESATDGTSFYPTLIGHSQPQPEFLYWEFPSYGGQIAIRMGDWKALKLNVQKGGATWLLFDLKSDPLEMHDVAKENPEIIKKVEEIVAREHTTSPNERWRFEELDGV